MTPVINKGGCHYPQVDISALEAKYNAKYICDMAIKGRYGWTEQPYMIFYNETPPNPQYSQYFAFCVRDGVGYITDGSSVAGIPIAAIQHPETGEIIFSRYRHDFRRFLDGSASIDGGRDYTKCSFVNPLQHLMLVIRDGELQIEDTPDELMVEYTLKQE